MRLWILAVLFYGIGDTATTLINIFRGATELNPILNYLFTNYGEMGLISFKILIISCCYYVYRMSKSQSIPTVLFILGLIGVVINVWVNFL